MMNDSEWWYYIDIDNHIDMNMNMTWHNFKKFNI